MKAAWGTTHGHQRHVPLCQAYDCGNLQCCLVPCRSSLRRTCHHITRLPCTCLETVIVDSSCRMIVTETRGRTVRTTRAIAVAVSLVKRCQRKPELDSKQICAILDPSFPWRGTLWCVALHFGIASPLKPWGYSPCFDAPLQLSWAKPQCPPWRLILAGSHGPCLVRLAQPCFAFAADCDASVKGS